jgi:hypothetical protein
MSQVNHQTKRLHEVLKCDYLQEPRTFHWGKGPGPEAIYNFFDFKKVCYANHVTNTTVTLFAAVFIYIFRDSLTKFKAQV